MFPSSALPFRSHMLQRQNMSARQNWRPTVPALQAKSAGKAAVLNDMPGIELPEHHTMKAMAPYRGGGGMPGTPALPPGYIMIPDPNAPIHQTFGQRLAAQAGNGRKKGKGKGHGKDGKGGNSFAKDKGKNGKKPKGTEKGRKGKGEKGKGKSDKGKGKGKAKNLPADIWSNEVPPPEMTAKKAKLAAKEAAVQEVSQVQTWVNAVVKAALAALEIPSLSRKGKTRVNQYVATLYAEYGKLATNTPEVAGTVQIMISEEDDWLKAHQPKEKMPKIEAGSEAIIPGAISAATAHPNLSTSVSEQDYVKMRDADESDTYSTSSSNADDKVPAMDEPLSSKQTKMAKDMIRELYASVKARKLTRSQYAFATWKLQSVVYPLSGECRAPDNQGAPVMTIDVSEQADDASVAAAVDKEDTPDTTMAVPEPAPASPPPPDAADALMNVKLEPK